MDWYWIYQELIKDLPLIVFHGTRRINETDLAYSIHDSFSIVLSTYGILERYVDFFSEVWKDYSIDGRWDYVILDEGHKVISIFVIHRRFAINIQEERKQ